MKYKIGKRSIIDSRSYFNLNIIKYLYWEFVILFNGLGIVNYPVIHSGHLKTFSLRDQIVTMVGVQATRSLTYVYSTLPHGRK